MSVQGLACNYEKSITTLPFRCTLLIQSYLLHFLVSIFSKNFLKVISYKFKVISYKPK